MGSLSHLGIGLSFLFGCLLLGLVSEVYYVLWWKKRFINRASISNTRIQTNSNGATGISYLFCWKTPIFMNGSGTRQELSKKPAEFNGHEQDLELGDSHEKDMVLEGYGEESVESELMRLHNLSGPPRFLFTIMEETKEDLESEDGGGISRRDKSSSRIGSRHKCLSELFAYGESPYNLTPLASPSFKVQSLDCLNYSHGFNPLFESSTYAEINRLRFSPPPTFKFLRDAEEKLIKELMGTAEKKSQLIKDNTDVQDSVVTTEEKDESFVSVFATQNKQVLPLPNIPLSSRIS